MKKRAAGKTVGPVYSFGLFATPIGNCGIAWGEFGIAATQLPEKSDRLTKLKLMERLKGTAVEAPLPAKIKAAVKAINSHLIGELVDLAGIELDLNGLPPFHKKVYIAARKVPLGSTASYGQLARLAGSPAAARAVGQAMARNPFPLVVPCHRIMGHDGSFVGFSSYGGCSIKEKLLSLESSPEKSKTGTGTQKTKVRTASASVPSTAEPTGKTARAKKVSVEIGVELASKTLRAKKTSPEAVASRRERRYLPEEVLAKPASVGLKFTPGVGISILGFDSKKAIRHITKIDPKMGELIKRVGAFTLELDEMLTPFEALAESIVYQQLTGKAAATIFSRVKAIYGGTRLPAARIIMQTPDEKLRGAGLSTAKTLAIKDLAEKQHAGLIPTLEQMQQMSDAQIIERLTQVRGIGRWTVEMLLMFRLGRPDVLPIHDYGVRKGFAVTIGSSKEKLPTPKELEAYGERWRPYCSVAAWYLWRALELPENARIKAKV